MKVLIIIAVFTFSCCLISCAPATSMSHQNEVVAIWLHAADVFQKSGPTAMKLYLRYNYSTNKLSYDEYKMILDKLLYTEKDKD